MFQVAEGKHSTLRMVLCLNPVSISNNIFCSLFPTRKHALILYWKPEYIITFWEYMGGKKWILFRPVLHVERTRENNLGEVQKPVKKRWERGANNPEQHRGLHATAWPTAPPGARTAAGAGTAGREEKAALPPWAVGREGCKAQSRCPTSCGTASHDFLTRVDALLNRHKSEEMINSFTKSRRWSLSFLSQKSNTGDNELQACNRQAAYEVLFGHIPTLFGIFSTLTCFNTFWRVPTTPLI